MSKPNTEKYHSPDSEWTASLMQELADREGHVKHSNQYPNRNDLGAMIGTSGSSISNLLRNAWKDGGTPLDIHQSILWKLQGEPAVGEVVKLQGKVDRLEAKISRQQAIMSLQHKAITSIPVPEPKPKLHDLSEFHCLKYEAIFPQRLFFLDNVIILSCRSNDTERGGVSVSQLGIEALERYQKHKGSTCIIRMESELLGWIREVALDDLPRKKYKTWPDGRMGMVIDLWDIDTDEVEPIPELP